MNTKKFLAMLLALAMVLSMAACGGEKTPETTDTPAETTPENRIVVDRYGREVEIPYEVKTIVCLGSGAPRIAVYLQVTDMMIGVEDCDTGDVTVLRDYSWVYHDELKDRPSCGKGGGSGQNNAYPEQIIELQPDVILAGFSVESADELQNQTGIPVVCVS